MTIPKHALTASVTLGHVRGLAVTPQVRKECPPSFALRRPEVENHEGGARALHQRVGGDHVVRATAEGAVALIGEQLVQQ